MKHTQVRFPLLYGVVWLTVFVYETKPFGNSIARRNLIFGNILMSHSKLRVQTVLVWARDEGDNIFLLFPWRTTRFIPNALFVMQCFGLLWREYEGRMFQAFGSTASWYMTFIISSKVGEWWKYGNLATAGHASQAWVETEKSPWPRCTKYPARACCRLYRDSIFLCFLGNLGKFVSLRDRLHFFSWILPRMVLRIDVPLLAHFAGMDLLWYWKITGVCLGADSQTIMVRVFDRFTLVVMYCKPCFPGGGVMSSCIASCHGLRNYYFIFFCLKSMISGPLSIFIGRWFFCTLTTCVLCILPHVKITHIICSYFILRW